MPTWLAVRTERPASYHNTIAMIIAFIILGFIYFNLLHGDAVFLGSHYKPRMDSFAILTLSALCMGSALLFSGTPRFPEQQRYSLSVLLILTMACCAVVGFY